MPRMIAKRKRPAWNTACANCYKLCREHYYTTLPSGLFIRWCEVANKPFRPKYQKPRIVRPVSVKS